MPENPFLQPSSLPYQWPPFDRIGNEDYLPAFEAGMREQRAEVDAITRQPAPADFQNTVLALERSGRLLARVSAVFFNLNASNTDTRMEEIDSHIAPVLQAHEDAIFMDAALFERVDSIHARRDSLDLDPESRQLLERYHVEFVRAGARLPHADKVRLKDINARLSSLTTRFKQNVLNATREGAVLVSSVEELDGLSPLQIGAAASAARARGFDGKWLIALQNTTNQPPLAQLRNRALRERIYKASQRRAASGAHGDNTDVIADIVRLRAERAALLGYSDHASYQLEDESAADPGAVHRILSELAPVALSRARQDAADMQKLIDAEAAAGGESFALSPWDWAFYAEKLRSARFDFDQARVKPYFELENVLWKGVFHSARELYGLEFEERHDLPVYHPDVRVFEVFEADGTPLALFLADFFARDNKQGGAWMNSYVRQSRLFGQKPVVANNTNIPRPEPGEPALLTFEEVVTLFHEFGHALHGMLSDVQYAMLSGTALPRDFVEFPSQYNEMWAREPAVLANYARHHRSGEPLPPELLAKVLAAQNFDQGYATTEYLAAALLDQSWHRIPPGRAPAAAEVARFEAEALRAQGVDYDAIPPRYHSTYFSHIFAGGYSAGYYAYLWSEVLARDVGQWMLARGGLTRANGERLRKLVLSRGRTRDPQSMFREFYGGSPDIGPLLDYRGLGAAA